MSLIKLTIDVEGTATRIDVVAHHIMAIVPETGSNKTLVGMSDGNTLLVNETPRSVRGYVKKALAPAAVAEEKEEF